MWWIDLIVLGLLVIGFLIGVKKGFFSSILSLIALAASLVIAYFLADAVSALLENWFGLETIINNFVTDQFMKWNPSFVDFKSANVGDLTALINGTDLNAIIKLLINSFLNGQVLETPSSVAGIASPYIAALAINLISFTIIFAVVGIVFGILAMILKKVIRKSAGLSTFDKVFGGIFGVVKTAVWLAILLAVLTALCKIPSIGEVVIPVMDRTLVLKHIFALFDGWVSKAIGLVIGA